MAEKSYIWDVDGGGDASLMPYDEDIVADWLRWLFLHDSTYQGVIPGIGDELEVTNPSGTDIQIGTGAALVRGTLYWNDEDYTFEALRWSPVDTYYYRIVLAKWWASKAVVLDDLGPSGAGYPALTQTDGVQWQMNLADVEIDTSGVVTIADQRRFIRTNDRQVLKSPLRVGDTTDKNWNVPTQSFREDQIWVQHTARMQVGAIRWTGVAAASGSIVVTFPTPFAYAPICIVQDLGVTGQIMTAVQTTTTDVTIYWEDEAGTTRTSLWFMWMAAGPIMGGE